MDTSEQYIKMCDYPEIQGPKREGGVVHGDYIYSPSLGNADIFCGNPSYRYGMMGEIWLPRQSQLQEMVELVVTGQTGYPEVSAAVLDKLNNYQWHGFFKSMEQLWLAFVMKEKFSKTWDGDKWARE